MLSGMLLRWLRNDDRSMNKNISDYRSHMAQARGSIATCTGGIFESVSPCSPVGPTQEGRRADCSFFLSPMHLFRIRSKSQKRSDRPQVSNSASNSSLRPPLVPQTKLALSPEDTCSSSSSSLSDNLDVSPSRHPLDSKISHSEPDEPK
jgi:hypothetical protein